jgi:tRNA(Arg) A34 adenosine deaminase TadA
LSAALWARIDRVVYAADRHDAAAAGFDDSALYELFTQPREEWKLSVRQVRTGFEAGPFVEWENNPDKVDY